jgi:hypothetical protein
MAEVAALSARLDAVLQRLAQLELAAGVVPQDALAHRQLAILDRLARLEAVAGVVGTAAAGAAAAKPKAAAAATPPPPPAAAARAPAPAAGLGSLPAVAAVDASSSEVQQRLQAELLERGLARHKFVRAPPEYYDRPLEFR